MPPTLKKYLQYSDGSFCTLAEASLVSAFLLSCAFFAFLLARRASAPSADPNASFCSRSCGHGHAVMVVCGVWCVACGVVFMVVWGCGDVWVVECGVWWLW